MFFNKKYLEQALINKVEHMILISRQSCQTYKYNGGFKEVIRTYSSVYAKLSEIQSKENQKSNIFNGQIWNVLGSQICYNFFKKQIANGGPITQLILMFVDIL